MCTVLGFFSGAVVVVVVAAVVLVTSDGVLVRGRVLTRFGRGTWRTCLTAVEGLAGLGGGVLASDKTLVACVLIERSDEAD